MEEKSTGAFLGFELGLLVPVKGKVYVTVYKDILGNCMLSILWQQCGEDMVSRVWCGGT